MNIAVNPWLSICLCKTLWFVHPFDCQSSLGTVSFKARWLFTDLGLSAAFGPVPKGYHLFSLYHHLDCALVHIY